MTTQTAYRSMLIRKIEQMIKRESSETGDPYTDGKIDGLVDVLWFIKDFEDLGSEIADL